MKLCSHTLITDCCKQSVCLNCGLDLADQQAQIGSEDKIKECIFCIKNVEKQYMLRDPYKAEEKKLAKETAERAK